MKRFFFIVLICSMSVCFTACNNSPPGESAPNSATITITEPLPGSNIYYADTLKLRGSIVSTLDLHGYTTRIIRLDNSTEVFFYDDHYHGNHKNLHINWLCTVHESVELRLTITAKLDHHGNTTHKSVDFFCTP